MDCRLALGLSLLLLASSAAAQMYKCVDERGVTHYTDKPRPDCKGSKVDIRPIPPLSGENAAPPSSFAAQDAEFRRRQIEGAQSEEREKAALDQRCTQLRRELDFLSHGGRISNMDAQGRRVYIDDATRAARLAKVKEQLRLCP